MNNQKIKVMIIISRFDACGPNMILLPIVKKMKENEDVYDIHILTLYCERKRSMSDSFEKLGIDIRRAEISSNKRWLNICRAIKNWERVWQPDIVYSSGLSADFYTVNTLKNKKLCCTLHNNAYEDLEFGFGRIIGKIGECITYFSIIHMDYVICCSKTLQSIYQKRFPKKQIYSIQNGTDVSRFQCRDKVGNDRSGKVIFLVSGSLDNRKDPITIINAFCKAQINDRAVLIFVGTGKLAEQCKELAKGYNIIFLGFIDDVEKYYQMADIYISASHSEGLPNSVLEAGSCGCRMILSDILQHREIFNEHNELVTFFKADDVLGLSELLIKNLRYTEYNERKEISRYIGDHFNSDIMATKYCDFISNCVNEA